jgi:hypothetical protein
MEPPPIVLSRAQAEALTRAQALAAELGELVAALRAAPAVGPAPPRAGPVEPPPEPDETLAAGDLRAAFAAAVDGPRRRPRWARDLLG